MEGLHVLKELLKKGDFLWEVNLKDAYSVVLLHEESQNFVCLEWKDKLCQFVYLSFDLAPVPLVFTKLMKIPIVVIKRLNGTIIFCLDEILLITGPKEDLLILTDTLIFLLQNLGFVINFKKSVLDPCHVLEFLRVEHPKKKVVKIKKRYQSLFSLGKISVRDLAKLTGRLSSTAMEVLPVPLQYRSLQQQQNIGLSMRGSYEDTTVLQKEAKMEQDWWVQNLDLNNGWCILSTATQIVIQFNASKSGWEQCAKGNQLGALGHNRKGENISTFSN